jgi:hypothetical protein
MRLVQAKLGELFMSKFLLMFLLGIIALLGQSCSQETTQTTPTQNTSNPPANTSKTPANSANSSQSPANTNVSASNTSNTSTAQTAASVASEPAKAVNGLIPSTNPDRRIQASIKGRKDPFSFVSLIAKIKLPEKKATDVAAKPNNKPKNFPSVPASVQSTPVLEPPRSEPSLAQSVAVTGVIDIGGILKAIVQAPEEKESRYVEVGQYLSNGQILVKNIDTSDPLNPSVVFEQNGVEVSRKVGEASANSNSQNTQASVSPGLNNLSF